MLRNVEIKKFNDPLDLPPLFQFIENAMIFHSCLSRRAFSRLLFPLPITERPIIIEPNIRTQQPKSSKITMTKIEISAQLGGRANSMVSESESTGVVVVVVAVVRRGAKPLVVGLGTKFV